MFMYLDQTAISHKWHAKDEHVNTHLHIVVPVADAPLRWVSSEMHSLARTNMSHSAFAISVTHE